MSSNAKADDHDDSLVNATAVAIDKDKNSQLAVRWAVDNLTAKNSVIVLIHIHSAVGNGQDDDTVDEVQPLFTPYRGYCARKGARLKEVVLDHIDVASAIADYINSNLIGNVVFGASGRNVLTRSFSQNIELEKSLILSTQKAQRAPTCNVPQKTASMPAIPFQNLQDNAELDPDGVRSQSAKGGWRSAEPGGFPLDKINDPMRGPQRERSRISISTFSTDSTDLPLSGGRSSTSRDFIPDGSLYSGIFTPEIMDSSAQGLDFSIASASSLNEPNADSLEAEMRRLRLELKQTMEMYSTACKEALSAKQKVVLYRQ
ncbi:unnamed protein product [Dovyalis caffra]|uniref:RING-type E3 ubiquitin transferase n=1 Tax=Dovyalis caffra TaxID=77055 RepID=A0AAV1SMX9_9ROSI|nr:unnamed protein product [Dovyalis caffra]